MQFEKRYTTESDRLYVGNLPVELNNVELASAFATFGHVIESDIVTDTTSGQSRGFGFVKMESSIAAKAAIHKLNGTRFEGRKLIVTFARNRLPHYVRHSKRGG